MNIKDQENASGTIDIGWGDDNNGRDYMVQGFKPSSAVSNITHIAFHPRSKPSGDIGYKIWIDEADSNSVPLNGVGGIGGVTLLANADIVTGVTTKYALTTPVNLVAGNQYVICFAPWNLVTDTWANNYHDWRCSVANPYANGKRAHGNTAYTTWSAPDNGNADLLFETWGDEPSAAGTNMKVNIADVFKDISEININVNDEWKSVTEAKINVGDSWRTIF